MGGLFVEFWVCAKDNEIYCVRINFFVNGAQVAGDVYASVSLILSLERMIVEKRMEGILQK